MNPAINISREQYFKEINKELLINPLRIIALITIVSGLLAVIFEVKYFQEFSIQVYLGRLIATLTAFVVFILTFGDNSKRNPVIFVHILLLAIILSFGSVIYYIPETIVINSNLLALVIFTVALFLSWEIKHQIVLAIYYNLVFSVSIIFNDHSIYFLPNLFETVLFVLFISVMGVFASSYNYKLRRDAVYKSFEAARSRQKYENMFNNSVDGIFQLDGEYRLTAANGSMAQILGFDDTAELLRNGNFDDLIYSLEFEEQLKHLMRTQGKAKNLRISLKNKDGKEVRVRINAVAVKDADDEIINIEGSVQDISKQVALEQQKNDAYKALKLAKLKAEENTRRAEVANVTKTKFLAKINHDLRIPLNNVLGYMELIENMAFKDMSELKELAKTARISADTLLDIIGDNIDIARIETGNAEPRREKFSIEEVIERTMILINSKIEQKGLTFVKKIADNVPVKMIGDPPRYRQILLNLLSNAVKFTRKGFVKLELGVNDISNNRVELLTVVTDTGPGINKDDLAKIFEPFKRGESTKVEEGVGLGLAICKDLVKMLNGSIKVKSEPGKGSRFEFVIPFEIAEEAKPKVIITKREVTTKEVKENNTKPKPEVTEQKETKVKQEEETPKPDGPKILVVDDNVHNRNVEVKLLVQLGYDAEGVASGFEALRVVNEIKYDLILMDIQMEGMDGLETTQKIRQLGDEFAELPIIAVTAHSSMQDRERCISNGMNDYVEKPISIRYLKMIIDQWLDQRISA